MKKVYGSQIFNNTEREIVRETVIFASDRTERQVIIVQGDGGERRRVLPVPISSGMTEREWLASPALLDSGAAFTEEQEAEILAAYDQRQLTGEAVPILPKPYVMPQLAAPPEEEHDLAA